MWNFMKNQNTQESLVQDKINIPKESNEKNRRIKNEITRESKNKNDGVQLSTRYQQYSFAKFYLRGTSRPEVFPIFGESGKNCKIYGRASNINGHDYLKRIYSDDGIAPTLPTGTGGNHYAKIARAVLTPDRAEKRQNGRRMKTNGEPSFTLTGQDIHGVMVDETKIRRLTPIETERLQGFEDNWTQYGADGELISDSQRYKMTGNAVTTNVISAIISRL